MPAPAGTFGRETLRMARGASTMLIGSSGQTDTAGGSLPMFGSGASPGPESRGASAITRLAYCSGGSSGIAVTRSNALSESGVSRSSGGGLSSSHSASM